MQFRLSNLFTLTAIAGVLSLFAGSLARHWDFKSYYLGFYGQRHAPPWVSGTGNDSMSEAIGSAMSFVWMCDRGQRLPSLPLPQLSMGSSERRYAMRRGISLLEVLVAILVLTVGILGVATILPIAKFYSTEASKYDRGAALRNRAQADALINGHQDPEHWIALTASGPAWASLNGIANSAVPDMSIAMIDPLGAAWGGFSLAVATCPPSGYGISGQPVIPRLTVTSMPSTQYDVRSLIPMPMAIADQRFRGVDDLQFKEPEGRSRPIAVPSPQPESEGSFSYAMMCRHATEVDQAGAVTFKPDLSVFDVLVYAKRDLMLSGPSVAKIPPERTVLADINGLIFGGNLNITLRSPTPSWATTQRNQWILLSIKMTDSTAPGGTRTFAQWYIIAGGDGAGTGIIVNGAPWPSMASGWSDADLTTPEPTVYATLFDGLIVVSEMTDENTRRGKSN